MVVAERPAKTKRRSRAAEDPVTRYARDAIAGRITVGKTVRQACDRRLKDLNRTDIFFNPASR